MLCERSFENSTKKNGDDDYLLPILLSTSVIAAAVIFSFLYETTPLNSVLGLIFLPVFGFVMYLTAIIFCITWKVLDKRYYFMSKADYHSVIDLVLTFLWILSLGNSVYSIFTTIVRVQCAIEDVPARKTHIAIGAYRIIQTSFMFVQNTVLSDFSKLRLKQTKLIQCTVVITLLTNAIPWIANIANIQRITSVNSTHCYWNTHISTKIIIPLQTVMLSTEQEYCFLSAYLISSLFLSKHWRTCSFSSCDIDHKKFSIWRSMKPSRGLIISSIISFLLHLPCFVIFVMREPKPNMWTWAITITNTISLLIIFYGIYILRRITQNVRNSEVQPDYFFDNDLIYILCTAGAIVYATIGMSLRRSDRGTFDMETIKYTIYIMENYYHTIFILNMKKVREKYNNKLQFVLVFLLFSNISTWLAFQFWLYSISYSDSDEILGPLHPAIKHTLYILICIYRFQSCIYLYQFYKNDNT